VSEADLVALVGELVGEVRGATAGSMEVNLASRLDRDLGIDSLGRTELILRIERRFSVQMPVEIMGQVETVGDLLLALNKDRPSSAPATALSAPVLPTVAAATEARTLTEALDFHAAQHSDRLHATVLQDDRTAIATMTYGQLALAARAVAAGLLAREVAPGDRIALMLPTGTDFFTGFFGILYAGAVPVPIYPPMQLTQIEDYARRQAGILRNAGARILITVPEGLRLGSLLRSLVATIESVESVASLSASSSRPSLPGFHDASATALIQYTSGSTGDPKGVVLSHANLLANIRSIGRTIDASSADVMVSWLPLYHDMGLIGAWLGSLYFGAPLYIMSPLVFLARPQSWLWAIHRFRGTISAAPNFAFELCLDKIDDSALSGLDLHTLRLVANGAEPVNISTMGRFIERFRRYGFRPEAMAPVYGLAENAVAVSLPPPGQPPAIDRISRKSFSRRGIAEAAADPSDVMEVVGCGPPIPGHEVRIVDDHGVELAERQEGQLEFRGPSATSGYFRNETKTRELFHDGWLVSGDRGYVADGRVFITGRIKDIVIRGGQHIYPHEVENAVGSIPGIRTGDVAMFGVADRSSGTERIVVLAETDTTDPAASETLRTRTRQATVDAVGVAPDDIVLVRPGTIPKTQSGKIRRAAARDLYLTGHLGIRRTALRWQMVRLALAGLPAGAARAARAAMEVTYALWWWAVVSTAFLAGVVAIAVLPKLSWRWSAVRSLARLALATVGARPAVSGTDRIPRQGAVLIFNHSSYADALVLGAVLPGEPAYLAKKELAGQWFIGFLLRRLGALFVERFDLAESLADIADAIAVASRDRTLVIFPEGTFTRRAGLSGFYLGGFKIAAEAGLPVIPGVLRGTRSMLRSDQWWPRRTRVGVDIGEPLRAEGKDFASILRLRDAARLSMLARCGEPDLNELIKPPPPARSGPTR
jgi:1-acyl-sn-glycerol-3-phosphate acyltransferase